MGHYIKLAYMRMCEQCGVTESVQHAIMECGRYWYERRALKTAMERVKVVFNLENLLRVEMKEVVKQIYTQVLSWLDLFGQCAQGPLSRKGPLMMGERKRRCIFLSGSTQI